jgi:RNA polymerase sigma-70 factor (family 1)
MVHHAILPSRRAEIAGELLTRDRTDSARIAAIRAGNEAAFEAVFREHYGRLCAVAARIVGCGETAEEVVQSVLLRVWRQREDLAITGTLAGYLYCAVRNGALMHLRRERLERRWQEQASAEGASPLMGERPPQPDEWTRSAELTTAIQYAIQQLPPRCQEAYVLRREKHLSYAEIAQLMGISTRTVEVQIGTALRALRKRLADWRE